MCHKDRLFVTKFKPLQLYNIMQNIKISHVHTSTFITLTNFE